MIILLWILTTNNLNLRALKNIGLLVFILIITSCSTSRKVAQGKMVEMKTSALINNVLKQSPQFIHLTINSRVNANIDNNSVGLNGKIYIKNGEQIWVNISKFGITAARANITPEGFQAFEKLGQTYIDGDFTYFNQLLKVDFIDYEKLQNLLLGRIFVELNPREFKSEIIDQEYVLSHIDNEKLKRRAEEGKYIQTYFFDHEFKLKKALLKDPKSNMELLVEYAEWTTVGPQNFPKSVKVLVKDKKTQEVHLEYNNFTFEESSTPFSIPSSYQPNKLLK